MEQRVFHSHQKTDLRLKIQEINPQKIFLVRGNDSFYASGADSFIKQLIGNYPVASFYDFKTNPQLEDVKKGIEQFQKENFELIIAIGGGSVLDMAKLISIFGNRNTGFENIFSGKAMEVTNKAPIIAIPTTAGTGAEATKFAVLYDNKIKYSVEQPEMLPEYVYISSVFSLFADSYLTACTGLDAFCQAVESVWCINSTSESEKYALEAIDLIWRNIRKAVNENDASAKTHMQEASYLAGKAINITKTTAPHALSYAFTSFYSIPHGHAVALSLPFFLVFNYGVTDVECKDPRGAKNVKDRIEKIVSILNVSVSESEIMLRELFNSIGINININTLVDNFDPEIIMGNVNFERISNNPRIVSKSVIYDFITGSI
ncbi:MAG: phosphonoacetaldehyde reductase [Salinivirgaceae bacterium]